MLHYKTIHPTTLELLKLLQSLPELANTRLVGGTALALQIGHRSSVDIDLFGSLNIEMALLPHVLANMATYTPITESKAILTCLLNNIKVDIVNYKYAWLQEDLVADNIKMANLKDIAAMKFAAITGRGLKKDFIDLYFLLQHFSLDEMFGFYSQKYPDGSKILVLKSLAYFGDADGDVLPLLFNQIEWDTVKETITNQLLNYNKSFWRADPNNI